MRTSHFMILVVLIFFKSSPYSLFASADKDHNQTMSAFKPNNPISDEIRMGDPFVVEYDDTYYLTGTTDAATGFRLWSSKDLVHWKAHGFVFKKTSDSWGNKNFWAPELFKYNGAYYLAYSVDNGKDGFRLCLAVADKPTGPYRDLYAPWCDFEMPVIDAHVFINQDNIPYLYYAEVGVKEVPLEPPQQKLFAYTHGVQLTEDLSSPANAPKQLLKPEQPWERPKSGRSWANEGAFVMKHGDYYYMTYSANHYAEKQYGIGYATAKEPLGPWTKADENPILKATEENGISGPGHCCFIKAPNSDKRLIVYHAHVDPERPSGNRNVNIDYITFTEQDEGPPKLKILATSQ